MTLETISEHRSFGGTQGFYRHQSQVIGLPMRFAVFQPPQAQQRKVPVLFYLAGLTCTEETFTIKAGAQRVAAQLGLMLVACDTSPRNTGSSPARPTTNGRGAGWCAGHEHEPELRRDALRAGLDGEGLLGAGEARQIEQHRHLALLRLRRLKDREAHRQADHLRLVAGEPLRAAKAAMLADGFERHRYSIRRPRRLPPHYESDPRRAQEKCQH